MELIIVGSLYAEIALGLYVVRGENVVLLGEIDAQRETSAPLQQVCFGLPWPCLSASRLPGPALKLHACARGPDGEHARLKALTR